MKTPVKTKQTIATIIIRELYEQPLTREQLYKALREYKFAYVMETINYLIYKQEISVVEYEGDFLQDTFFLGA